MDKNQAQNDKAREQAKEVLAKVAKKLEKTHHLGRDGTWLINSKTNEVEVGISKKGFTGLAKITMPVGKLPKEAQKYGIKAVQAHHMTWLQFDVPMNILEKAINARAKSPKTSKQFSKDVYGTEMAPCWVKAKKEVKKAKKSKAKAKGVQKSAKKALKKKATKTPKKAEATA